MHKRFKIKTLITLIVLYLLFSPTSIALAESDDEESVTDAADETNFEEPAEPRSTLTPPVETESATLMDAETGIVLYGKVQDESNYPASVTKIMTALLTLELCDDLDERITFSKSAVYSLPRDASHIAMDEGETLTVYDALHGLLLASANEVANALAEHLAGSVEDFAALMNKRAIALGAVNTHFENPSGLFEENHKTTSYDMALIMREAVKHDEFNEIISKRRYDIQPTEKQPEVRELLNSNQLIQPGDFFNEWVVGGKTGYTDEAMHTLVTYAEKDGRALIVSAMRGTRDGVYEDTASLLDYGFGIPYESQVIFDNETYLRTVPVFANGNETNESIGQVTAKSKKNLTFELPENFDMSDVRYELDLPEKLDAPVLLGDKVGTLTCYIQNVKVGETDLNALNAVYAPEAAAEEESVEVFGTDVRQLPAESADETNFQNGFDATEDGQKPDINLTEDFPLWDLAYFKSLAVPIGLTALMLLVTFFVYLKRRKRKRAGTLSYGKYMKYTGDGFYRYK